MSNTSIGPDYDKGGNENHDGRQHRTMGEASYPEVPPAGADPLDDAAAPQLPAGVPGAQARPKAQEQAGRTMPEGPNVESGPWEADAAKGKPPGQGA